MNIEQIFEMRGVSPKLIRDQLRAILRSRLLRLACIRPHGGWWAPGSCTLLYFHGQHDGYTEMVSVYCCTAVVQNEYVRKIVQHI